MMDEIAEAAQVNLPVVKSTEITFPAVESLTDEQISKILKVLPLFKPYFDSVAEYALSRALNGDIIEGYKLVKGRQGNRVWVDESAVEEAFKGQFGDSLYEKKLLTPAKLEKLLGKNKKEVEPYTTRPEAKLSLAPLDDKREAIEPNKQNILTELYGESE